MMNRRTFLISGAAASLGGSLRSKGKGSRERKPNVILMMADDMGWGDPGFNGNQMIRTPNLDAMAKAGIRFPHFYSGGPVCSPTRGTCLTGRHYFRYGITDANRGFLPGQEITMATMLKSEGYTTGHFGKWHLGSLTTKLKDGRRGGPGTRVYMPPWEQGFDECFSTEVQMPTWNPMQDQAFPAKYWTGPDKYATENLEGDDSRIIMDRVVPFIEHASTVGTPFLAVVWFHAPHEPVVAGPAYKAMYANYDEGAQDYYGCITALDEQVGRLRALLRKLNIEKDTMLWFCSDNGPDGRTGTEGTKRGSTGGLRGRKFSLFSGGTNVPGLLEWPGHVKAGRVEELSCSTLDYFPTVQEIVGYRFPNHPRPLDGISLVPLIRGRMKSRPTPICFRYVIPKKAMFDAPMLAMVEGKYKLLTNLVDNGKNDLLFDIEADRGETANICTQHPELVRSMKEQLTTWMASCERSFSGADYDDPAFKPHGAFTPLRPDWPMRGQAD